MISTTDKLVFWFTWSICVFWGALLTQAGLEHMGVGPNIVVRTEWYGSLSFRMAFPMLAIGIICLLCAALLKMYYNLERSKAQLA